jgi:hypothetical protein
LVPPSIEEQDELHLVAPHASSWVIAVVQSLEALA